MSGSWALRTMKPDALLQYGLIHLRRVQSEPFGKKQAEHAAVVENALLGLADQLLTLTKEIDSGVYSRSGWPKVPHR